jgi:hypothetical protein
VCNVGWICSLGTEAEGGHRDVVVMQGIADRKQKSERKTWEREGEWGFTSIFTKDSDRKYEIVNNPVSPVAGTVGCARAKG